MADSVVVSSTGVEFVSTVSVVVTGVEILSTFAVVVDLLAVVVDFISFSVVVGTGALWVVTGSVSIFNVFSISVTNLMVGLVVDS